MKVMTVLGTRPEIIRLSRVIEKLDSACEHLLVHTGQNFDPRLKDVFFEQLHLRQPDFQLDAQGPFGAQLGCIATGVERLITEHQPDRFLVLGDTNSGLSALIAKRMGIPVFHMEAGNRCFDDRVPEEVNRRVIDHSSDVLMPYTERSRQNLLQEGIRGERIFVTGNPIYEVIQHYDQSIRESQILAQLGLEDRKFFLVTLHRAENVDQSDRLLQAVAALDRLQQDYAIPLVVSTHPRTRARLAQQGGLPANQQVRFLEPFSFFDFISLERSARCVLTDSGTVQEECTIFGVPNVTLRDTTERPETRECGGNILSGLETESICRCVKIAMATTSSWSAPPEYLVPNVSETVLRLVLGHCWK